MTSETERREAAVLIPVYRDADGDLRLLLIRRTEGGRHGGHIALPGGNRESGDPDLLTTALREAHEEIGLAPADLEVLAELAPIDTRTTGMRISPVLARVVALPATWRLQASEVAEVLDVSVADLLDPSARGQEEMTFAAWEGPRVMPVIAIGPDRVWGVTLRILEPVLLGLRDGRWSVP